MASTICGFMKHVRARALTRDESSADEDVDVQTLLGKQFQLSLDELLGHLFSVAALAFPRLLHIHLQRLGSQGLKLLQGCSSVGVYTRVKRSNIPTTSEFNLLAKFLAGAFKIFIQNTSPLNTQR